MHRDLCDRGSQIQIRILSKERTLTCMNNPIGKFVLNLLVLVLYQEKIHRLKAIVNVARERKELSNDDVGVSWRMTSSILLLLFKNKSENYRNKQG